LSSKGLLPDTDDLKNKTLSGMTGADRNFHLDKSEINLSKTSFDQVKQVTVYIVNLKICVQHFWLGLRTFGYSLGYVS